MKQWSMPSIAIAMSAMIVASPLDAHEAPRLVEYISSVGDMAAGPKELRARVSRGRFATLEAIRDDPSAVDVRIGRASLDAVRDARALSLVLPLPRSAGAGPETIASFGNLEIKQRSEHDYSVHGRNETPESEVSLAVLGQDVVGRITYEGEVFEARPLGGGLTAVYRRDTSRWPEDAECGVSSQPLQSPQRKRSNESGFDSGTSRQESSQPDTGESPAPGDSGETIDVLVAYTPRARTAAGNIDALIRLFFDDTNRFLSNSQVRTRVRPVHSYRTEYRQTDTLLTDINRLKAPDDGFMDEVHARRNQYGGDLVALLVARNSDYCGRGDLYHGWESGAFSVSAQSCGSDTFAHELGHNLGAHHDPDTDTNTGFPYGHGLCNSRRNWRTIMSYNFNNGCRPRAPHFSNPNVSYQGTRTGDEGTRNNTRVINETAQHVATFRTALPPPHSIPLVLSADHSAQEGFVRIINRSGRPGKVRIDAFDDEGRRFGPVDLSLDARQTRHFNSTDLEDGNASKGLSGGVRNGSGDWRLELSTNLDIKPRAYIRTTDGFLTSIHEVAGEEDEGTMRYRVPTFNPGKNTGQQSRLRLINVGDDDASVEISGEDDQGDAPPGGSVRLTLRAGAAHMVSAQELEQGAAGISGQFGSGTGKWQLSVSADQPLLVMSLLFSRTGNLTNLSR